MLACPRPLGTRSRMPRVNGEGSRPHELYLCTQNINKKRAAYYEVAYQCMKSLQDFDLHLSR